MRPLALFVFGLLSASQGALALSLTSIWPWSLTGSVWDALQADAALANLDLDAQKSLDYDEPAGWHDPANGGGRMLDVRSLTALL
jgi:hypothetical protein